MIKAVKKYFRDRKVKRVRAESRGLANVMQQRYEDDIRAGRRIVILAGLVGDIKIWSVEEGVL